MTRTMKRISAALAVAAFAAAGAALACEGHATHAMSDDDSLAFTQPNASQKPVVIAVDSRTAAADKPSAAVKKTAGKPDAAPKTASTRAGGKCTGSDC